MSGYFDKIIVDYTSAEITSLILHNRLSGQWFNLFTVIELIPSEQVSSELIKGQSPGVPADRENIDKDFTLYMIRVIDFDKTTALEIFKSPDAEFTLNQGSTLNCLVELFEGSHLEQEPASDHPLIIDKQTEHTYGDILPHRHTDFRLWAKIDRHKKWLNTFTTQQKNTLIEKCGLLSIRHLGFDLSRMTEHLGNIYLCACNPYLRRYNCTLLDYNKELLISFYERESQSIIGKKIVLEEKRAGNIGFSIEKTIESKYDRIQLPHFPDILYTKIYDANGFLLENHSGSWVNISFGIQMQTSVLNLSVKDGDKTSTQQIPKYASEKPVQVGNYDKSLAYFMKLQQRSRQIEDLETSREFIFFPGGEADKEKARELVGEIINKAKERCIFLDPYFGAGDLLYAYVIRSTSVPIQIISSSAFLKESEPGATGITYAERLNDELRKFRGKFPYQKIECRVLRGRNKSPLHDRYIVVDDTVYMLGSSLNEFGNRASSLIKVPAPEILIKQANEWWTDEEKTESLEQYVINKTKDDESKNSKRPGAKILQFLYNICKKIFGRTFL
ncbi:VPA1262 family N-terminal domain-containing protein [Ferruginibacter sp.]|nr:hypothetical protein [Ferruginibacter sp.]